MSIGFFGPGEATGFNPAFFRASRSTRSAFAKASWIIMTDWIVASILPLSLCDWSIM